LDLHVLLDVDFPDNDPRGSGLGSDEFLAEKRTGRAFNIPRRRRAHNAAGFPTASGMDLRFDDPGTRRQFMEGVVKIFFKERNTGRNRDPGLLKDSLGLIFVKLHSD
jgi:hypothetical protein